MADGSTHTESDSVRTPPRRHRTQAERTAATRTRLLDATVECLSELGYASTSTTEVVLRAGVSRGAQVHHFPTKADLVIAAMEHLLKRRLEEFRALFLTRPEQDRTVDDAVTLLWQMFQGPIFDAWLELLVASRTDAVLHTRLAEVMGEFDDEVEGIFGQLFPAVEAAGVTPVAARFTFAVMEGLAIQQLVKPDPASATEVLGILRMFGQTLLPTTAEETP